MVQRRGGDDAERKPNHHRRHLFNRARAVFAHIWAFCAEVDVAVRCAVRAERRRQHQVVDPRPGLGKRAHLARHCADRRQRRRSGQLCLLVAVGLLSC